MYAAFPDYYLLFSVQLQGGIAAKLLEEWVNIPILNVLFIGP